MANRVAPDKLKASESDLSLSLQRNEQMVKTAKRQMEQDSRERNPKKGDQQRKSRSRPPPDEGKERTEKPNTKSSEKQDEHKNAKHVEVSKTMPSPSVDELSASRMDAVVFIVVLAQVIGCLAVGFEIYVYSLDQEWNSVLNGERPITEVDGHNIFTQKTLKLTGNVYLEKAKEYAIRNEPQEMLFIIVILVIIIVSFIQIIACYIKVKDVEQYAAMLIGLYSSGGAVCIFSSIFLVSAAINIENSYTYIVDMLHNFRFENDDLPIGSADQDKCNNEFKNGCDYYEYAKVQALYLERIFRLCGEGSRFTRYYAADTSKGFVVLSDEIYFRSELKEIGFCSRDGYKYVAAVCAIIMGVLFSTVPVIFCCEGRAFGKRASLEGKDECGTESKPSDQPPKPMQSVLKKRDGEFDPSAVIEQFRMYVEKSSEDDARKTKKEDVFGKKEDVSITMDNADKRAINRKQEIKQVPPTTNPDNRDIEMGSSINPEDYDQGRGDAKVARDNIDIGAKRVQADKEMERDAAYKQDYIQKQDVNLKERKDVHKKEREDVHKKEREDAHKKEREGVHKKDREGVNKKDREGVNKEDDRETEKPRKQKRNRDTERERAATTRTQDGNWDSKLETTRKHVKRDEEYKDKRGVSKDAEDLIPRKPVRKQPKDQNLSN